MRLQATRTSVTSTGVAGDALYRAAGSKPTLDQRFAKDKSLVDKVSGKNLVTFSRSSTGTYVDSDGLIKTSPVNLMPYSDYSQVASTTSATLEGTAVAPDGTNTARRYSASGGGNAINKIITSGTDTKDYTFSVWVRSTGSASQVVLQVGNPARSETVDISTEWGRYYVTKTNNTGTLVRAYVTLINTGDEVEVWGAQLEEDVTTPSEYIPTGSTISGAPRFDHDPETLESLGLLIEEGRTNVHLKSGSAAGLGITSVPDVMTCTDSSEVTSPTGVGTVIKLDKTAAGYGFARRTGPTRTATETFSVYVKKGTTRYVGLRLFQTPSTHTTFDLDTKTWTQTVGSDSRGYQELQNGWLRLWITGDNTANQFSSLCITDSVGTEDSTATGTVYCFGFQREEGMFPSSYIPTSDSTVTRAADLAKITGTNFSSWYNQSEGTVFVDAQSYPDPITGRALVPFAFSDNSYSNRITLSGSTGSSQFNFDVIVGGSQQRAILGNFLSSGLKASGGYKSTGSAGSLDGATAVTSSTTNIPSVISQIDIGQAHDGTNVINGHISRLAYFSTRRTDQELQRIAIPELPNSSLDLAFATNKSLTDNVSGNQNLIAFTRASSGTYVDSDGLIKTSPVNLLTYSEEFDQWTAGSNTTVTPNAAVAPDGTLTADRVVNPPQSSTYVGIASISANVTYTASVYAKAVTPGTNDTFTFNVGGGTGGVGVVASTPFTTTSEWQRFSFTITPPNVGTSGANRLYINNEGDSFTSDVYFWGAQLEEDVTAPSDYIPTGATISGAPRFDHDPVTGESLGLLIEEQRTNIVLNSDVVAGLSLGSNVIQSLENIVSPRGVSESVRKLSFGSAGANVWRVGSTVGGTFNTTYAISFWAKTVNGGSTSFNIDINDMSPAEGISTTIDGEWKRYVKVGGARNETYRFFDINMLTATEPIYIWGAQIEVGEYATSYIPTTSSTVTRAPDIAEITGTNFSSWYNQSEGTVFIDANGEGARLVGLNDGTDANRQELFQSGSNVFCFQKNANVNEVSISKTAENKSTFAYKANDYSLTSGGVSVVTDTSATPPTVDQMSIGNWYNNTGQLNGHIKRLTCYPVRLANSLLESITS